MKNWGFHITQALRCLVPRTIGCGVIFALLLPTLGLAADRPETPRTGLLWHNSGLPATFPLQVKTAPGQDYHLTLSDTATQKDVLAAYIVGGQFFRVLVPPGTYNLRFAHGATWQGAEALFGDGPETGVIEIENPLRFAVRGVGTKTGYQIDISAIHEQRPIAELSPRSICQSLRIELEPSPGSTVLAHEDTIDYDILRDDRIGTRADKWDEFRFKPDPPKLTRRVIVRSRVCG